MLGTEHQLWLTRGTLYNTALICRDDPEVLQGFSVTHRKQAQIDVRPCQRSPKQQVAERWPARRLAESWPMLVNLPHLHKQMDPWRLEKYPATIKAFFKKKGGGELFLCISTTVVFLVSSNRPLLA